MSYLREACGVTRWEGESNESICKRCGMGPYSNGVKCGVVKWMKRNMLERKKSEKFVKKVYMSKTRGSRRR